MGASCTIIAGILGGSVNNKIGPRYTLVIASASYPIWAGSLWSVLILHLLLRELMVEILGGLISAKVPGLHILRVSITELALDCFIQLLV